MKPVLLTLLLCVVMPFAHGCHLVLRVPPNDYPPSFYRDNGQWVGFSINMLKQLLKPLNCDYSAQSLPFIRGLAHLKRGSVDIMMHLSMSEERAKYIHYIGPMTYERLVFFTTKQIQPQIKSLTDIGSLKMPFAVQRGLHYSDEFVQLYENNEKFRRKVVSVNNFDQLTKMLERQRISGFLFSSVYGRDLQEILDSFSQIEARVVILAHHPIYFGFSKKSVDVSVLKQLELSFAQIETMSQFEFMLKSKDAKLTRSRIKLSVD